MKIAFLLAIAWLCLPILSRAQNITASEFVTTSKMNFNDINTFLLNKGWRYNERTEPDSTGYSYISWGLFSENSSDGRAKAWFVIDVFSDKMQSFRYEFYDKSIYNGVLALMKLRKIKVDGGNIKDNTIRTYFKTPKYDFILANCAKSEKTSPFYFQISVK